MPGKTPSENDTSISNVPNAEYTIIAADVNGNAVENTDNHKFHGGWGFETANDGGERIIDLPTLTALYLSIHDLLDSCLISHISEWDQ